MGRAFSAGFRCRENHKGVAGRVTDDEDKGNKIDVDPRLPQILA
jgi:hypothetical protein